MIWVILGALALGGVILWGLFFVIGWIIDELTES